MADGIVIKVDLDSPEYKAQLKEMQVETEKASKNAGESLDKNISKVLDSSVSRSVVRVNDRIKALNNTIRKVTTTAVKLAPIFIFLELRFKTFSKLFSKFGIDLEKVIDKITSLSDTFADFLIGEKNITSLKIAIVSLLNELGFMDNKIVDVIDRFGKFNFHMEHSAKAISTLAVSASGLGFMAKNAKALSSTFKDLSKVLLSNKAGLFGLVSSLSTTAVALGAVGKALQDSNNAFVKSVGVMANVTAILVGSLAVGISVVIVKISELAQFVGTKLVGFFIKASNSFNQTEQSLDVFRATVEAVKRTVGESISPFNTWESVVGLVADKFNLAREEVRKSAQEILLVGSKMGLATNQMRKLIQVSAEYAKINKKDVFQTTVNFVNALNGNAQAVSALGVKLSQTSLQQFAYAKGMTKTIGKMTEHEKVQLRMSKVMKQYAEISGIGVIAANSLAEADKRLKINQDRLTRSLGEGARIIEQNNILAFAYNEILNKVSSSVLTAAGFFGALGSRLLQFGGILLGISFKIFGIIKAFKLLQVLMSSQVGINAFAANIPIINKSLNSLFSTITKTNVEIKSLSGLMVALGGTVKQQFNSISKVIFGVGTKNLTVITALTGSMKQLKLAMMSLARFAAPFLIPFAKFIIIAGIIAGVIYVIVKAFKEIEKRTGALSELWDILLDAISDTSSIFDPVIDLFKDMTEAIVTLASKGFGLFVTALSSTISAITILVRKNPFNVFSEDTVARVVAVDQKLNGLRMQIAAVGFDIRKMADSSKRSIAGMKDHSIINLEAIAKTVNMLRERYENFGLTQVQILEKQKAAELSALEAFIEINNLKGQALAEHLVLKKQLEMDYLNQITAARDEAALKQVASLDSVGNAFKIHAKNMKVTAGDVAKTMMNLAISGFGRAFQSIGRAMANGGNAMQAFADSIKATFGELASALGDYYIKHGIAMAANPATSSAGYAMIAGGAGLKVLSGFLGASGGGGGGASGGGGGGIVSGTGGFQDQTTAQITDVQAERPEADTNLVVNIQGDILDSQESGKRIVDILGESFGKEGLILRDVRTA